MGGHGWTRAERDQLTGTAGGEVWAREVAMRRPGGGARTGGRMGGGVDKGVERNISG